VSSGRRRCKCQGHKLTLSGVDVVEGAGAVLLHTTWLQSLMRLTEASSNKQRLDDESMHAEVGVSSAYVAPCCVLQSVRWGQRCTKWTAAAPERIPAAHTSHSRRVMSDRRAVERTASGRRDTIETTDARCRRRRSDVADAVTECRDRLSKRQSHLVIKWETDQRDVFCCTRRQWIRDAIIAGWTSNTQRGVWHNSNSSRYVLVFMRAFISSITTGSSSGTSVLCYLRVSCKPNGQ